MDIEAKIDFFGLFTADDVAEIPLGFEPLTILSKAECPTNCATLPSSSYQMQMGKPQLKNLPSLNQIINKCLTLTCLMSPAVRYCADRAISVEINNLLM